MKPLFSFLISSFGIVKGCVVVLSLLTVVPQCRAESLDLVFPAKEWQQQAPQEQGMSATALTALGAKIGGRGVVVRNGFLVHSWGRIQQRGDWYSASNPLLSTLLWFAVEEGRIEGMREPVAAYYWDLDSKDREIDFWHLLNMTSGYSRPEPAGEAWNFNQYGTQLLQMTLFDRVFNAPPLAVLLQSDRLGPLQFEDRPAFRERSNTLVSSVRDYARIAWFWCQKGRWDEQQLLPGHYFEHYFQPQVDSSLPLSVVTESHDYLHIGHERNESEYFGGFGPGMYGFHWWFNAKVGGGEGALAWPDAPLDTVLSVGIRGNVAVIIPSRNLVLVSAYSDWGEFDPGDPRSKYNQFVRELVAAIQ